MSAFNTDIVELAMRIVREKVATDEAFIDILGNKKNPDTPTIARLRESTTRLKAAVVVIREYCGKY
jgi:hypothetical protein